MAKSTASVTPVTIIFRRDNWLNAKKKQKFSEEVTITSEDLIIDDKVYLVPIPRQDSEGFYGKVTFFERISPIKAKVGIRCL